MSGGNTIDGVKQGVWVDYTYRVELTAGENTIRIVSEGSNPGNYNLDSITFNYVDTSVNAFSQIEAESASYLEGDIVVAEDSSASDGTSSRRRATALGHSLTKCAVPEGTASRSV